MVERRQEIVVGLCLTFHRSSIKLAAGEPRTAEAGPSSLATSPRKRGAIMRFLFSGRIRLVVLLAVTLAGATALPAGGGRPARTARLRSRASIRRLEIRRSTSSTRTARASG